MNKLIAVGVGLGALCLAGCAERRIKVTSQPEGARVWINDQDIGVTPCESRFTFYGKYDLRVEMPGFEPYHGRHDANAPLWEMPGVDLAVAAVPFRFRNTVGWHVMLDPTGELDRDGLVDRAASLREQALSESED